MTPLDTTFLTYIQSKANHSEDIFYFTRHGVSIPLRRGEMVTTQSQLAKIGKCSLKTVRYFMKKYEGKYFVSRTVKNNKNRVVGTVFSLTFGAHTGAHKTFDKIQHNRKLGAHKYNRPIELNKQESLKDTRIERLEEELHKAYGIIDAIKGERDEYVNTVTERRIQGFLKSVGHTRPTKKFKPPMGKQRAYRRIRKLLSQTALKNKVYLQNKVAMNADFDSNKVKQYQNYARLYCKFGKGNDQDKIFLKSINQQWDIQSQLEKWINQEIEEQEHENYLRQEHIRQEEETKQQQEREQQKNHEDNIIRQWVVSGDRTETIDQLLDRSNQIILTMVCKQAGVCQAELPAYLATIQGIQWYSMLGLRQRIIEKINPAMDIAGVKDHKRSKFFKPSAAIAAVPRPSRLTTSSSVIRSRSATAEITSADRASEWIMSDGVAASTAPNEPKTISRAAHTSSLETFIERTPLQLNKIQILAKTSIKPLNWQSNIDPLHLVVRQKPKNDAKIQKTQFPLRTINKSKTDYISPNDVYTKWVDAEKVKQLDNDDLNGTKSGLEDSAQPHKPLRTFCVKQYAQSHHDHGTSKHTSSGLENVELEAE